PAHVYGAAGTYTVSLTSTGPGGSDAELKADYIVVLNAPPVAEFVADVTTGVEPLDVNFTDLTLGNVTSWDWNFGDGTSSSAQNPSHTYLAAGTYTVSLTATGLGGSDGEVKIGYIIVTHTPPVAAFVADVTTGVETLTVNFTDLTGGNVNAWAWDFGDGASATSQSPSHTYLAVGTYTVSLTATGLGGSDDEVKVDYILITNAPPVAVFGQDVMTGPAPLTVTFADQSTGMIDTWDWNFGDGSSSSLQSPDHIYAAIGLYTVSLTVTGPGGTDTVVATDLITVQTPASVALRNGSGSNAVVFQSSLTPVIGTTWEATIDVSGHTGATLTFVLGYDTPLAGIATPYGELLIANEVLGGAQLVTTSAVPIGNTATHFLPVPNDPSVEGFEVYFQGLILGGGPELVNALDVVLGY
ncbi:MAG: PKD repeat protein, partial [Planctomycetota bacterium]